MPKPQQEYKEQIVTIVGATQDVVKRGSNKGAFFERYELEGDDRKFYNFHPNHLIGQVGEPLKARIRYIDDSRRPKMEEIEILSDAGPNQGQVSMGTTKHRPYGELAPGDVLSARLRNIEHSLKALQFVDGDFEQKLKAYRQLLEENDEYLFEGLCEQHSE